MAAIVWDPQTWAEREFGECELGDRRRNKRLVKMAVQISARPDGSTPDQFETWGDLKAAYRLFDTEDVSFQAIVGPHCRHTRERSARSGQRRTPGVAIRIESPPCGGGSWTELALRRRA